MASCSRIPGISRRTLLRVTTASAAITAGTALLAACGGGAPAATASSTGSIAPIVASVSAASTPETVASSASSSTPATSSVASASSSQTTGSGTAAAATFSVRAAGQLLWTVWATEEAMKAHVDTVADFSKANPQYQVQVENIPLANNEYFDKVIAMIAGGSPPDAAMGSTTWTASIVAKGLWHELGSYIKRDNFDVASYFPASLKAYAVQGQQYALPDSTNLGVLVYNKDLLLKAGVKPPDDTWTWDTYVDAAKALTVTDSGTTTQFGSNQVGSDLLSFSSFIWMSGSDMFDDGQKPAKSTFSTAETIGAVRWMAELLTKYRAAPAPGATKGMGDPFLAGKMAMQFYSAAAIGDLAKQSAGKIDWDAAHLPRGPKTLATYVGGSGQGVAAATKNPDAAWKLVQFVCGQPGIQHVLAKQWGLPPIQKLATVDFMALPPPPANRKAIVDMVGYGRSMPNFPKMMEVYTPVYGKWLQQAMVGAVTPEEACTQIDNAINAVIAQK